VNLRNIAKCSTPLASKSWRFNSKLFSSLEHELTSLNDKGYDKGYLLVAVLRVLKPPRLIPLFSRGIAGGLPGESREKAGVA